MTILNGGGSSGVSPKNFNQGIEDVKSAVQDVQTSVNSLSSTMQSGMSNLQDSVEESLGQVQTTVENAPVGGPIPYIIDTGKFKAESVEEGIKLTYIATIHAKTDWDQFTARGSVPPYGVMIRYGTDGFPRTPNEGILAVDDTDIVDKTAKGPVTGNGLYGKTKTFTVVGLTNNTLYYFSAFPYSYNKVFNINYGPLGADLSTNNSQRKTCTWTGTKGTLTVTITQDYNYKTLGEITVTATPTAGGSAVSASRTGAGTVALSLDGGEYTVSFSAHNYYTTPESQTINVTAGQNNTASAEYKIIVGLENYTWEEVQAIAAGGDAKHFFSVGDKKTTSVGTVGNSNNYGTIYTDGDILGGNIVLKNLEATIVAINAHQTTSGTKNNVTFCVLDMPLRCKDQTRSMNWSQSCLRTCLNERKSEFLPEIHQYLIEVYNTLAGFDVYDGDTGRKSYRCNDYIYVPSISNASSASAVYDVMEEKAGGTHYPYFSSNEKRTLKSWEKEGTKTWVTSTVQSGEGYLVDISASGFVYFSNSGSNDYITADVTWKPICFNIG